MLFPIYFAFEQQNLKKKLKNKALYFVALYISIVMINSSQTSFRFLMFKFLVLLFLNVIALDIMYLYVFYFLSLSQKTFPCLTYMNFNQNDKTINRDSKQAFKMSLKKHSTTAPPSLKHVSLLSHMFLVSFFFFFFKQSQK